MHQHDMAPVGLSTTVARPRLSSSLENVCLSSNRRGCGVGGRINNETCCRLCIILPEDDHKSAAAAAQHQRQTYLSLVVESQTPVLDLLVYVSSVCHFNPSDYVLCLANSSGSILQPLRPSQKIGEFASLDSCEPSFLRVVAKQANNVTWQKMTAPTTKMYPLVFVPTVFLPNGRIWQNLRALVNQPSADQRLEHLLEEVCKENSLCPDEYVFRIRSDGTLPAHSIRLKDLLTSSNKDEIVLEIVPALKHCDLAETEASVDRMFSSTSTIKRTNNDFSKKTEQRKTVCFTDQPPTNQSFRSVNEYLKISNGTEHPARRRPIEYTSSITDEVLAIRQKRKAPPPPGSLINSPTNNNKPQWSIRSKSTIDDISEDFQQALSIGRETLFAGGGGAVKNESADHATQTATEFEPAKPFHIDQSVQTVPIEPTKTPRIIEESVGNLCSILTDNNNVNETANIRPLSAVSTDSYRRRYAATSSNISKIIQEQNRLMPIHVGSIIRDHCSLLKNLRSRSLPQPLKVPIELEVTERTTHVQCTVTVETEGKMVSSTARSLSEHTEC